MPFALVGLAYAEPSAKSRTSAIFPHLPRIFQGRRPKNPKSREIPIKNPQILIQRLNQPWIRFLKEEHWAKSTLFLRKRYQLGKTRRADTLRHIWVRFSDSAVFCSLFGGTKKEQRAKSIYWFWKKMIRGGRTDRHSCLLSSFLAFANSFVS